MLLTVASAHYYVSAGEANIGRRVLLCQGKKHGKHMVWRLSHWAWFSGAIHESQNGLYEWAAKRRKIYAVPQKGPVANHWQKQEHHEPYPPLVIPKTITRSERQDNIGPPFSFGTPHVGYGPFDPKMSIPAIYHESGRIQHNAIECPILVSPQILWCVGNLDFSDIREYGKEPLVYQPANTYHILCRVL